MVSTEHSNYDVNFLPRYFRPGSQHSHLRILVLSPLLDPSKDIFRLNLLPATRAHNLSGPSGSANTGHA
ncbi:hypothetical protein F751_3449 [Auxenochlorella protothecoides]|uniref:Uncharacterized protein n=1 Tax=Auxenochlorella protothecoides TaxID=3075 RepID=A0A087SC04_AUXPR|nr:hypothetical protein F751_3449 [Auxenochlorella protothecoides]KFM23258.1 hypothetical protein F751_3449 [Auxenochlorella protothecoides]